MRLLTDQMELFMVAAWCLLLGVAALAIALALWSWSIDKACQIIGVHGAVLQLVIDRANHSRWWWWVVKRGGELAKLGWGK